MEEAKKLWEKAQTSSVAIATAVGKVENIKNLTKDLSVIANYLSQSSGINLDGCYLDSLGISIGTIWVFKVIDLLGIEI